MGACAAPGEVGVLLAAAVLLLGGCGGGTIVGTTSDGATGLDGGPPGDGGPPDDGDSGDTTRLPDGEMADTPGTSEAATDADGDGPPDGAPEPCVGVAVSPGDDLQALADANPEDTTFCLAAGVHRFATCQPKNGDRFIGAPGALLTGARLLDGFTADGSRWKVTGQTQEGQVHADSCNADSPRCAYPEDLFYDDVPRRHVASLADVVAGTYYFDYAADTIYVGDDPTGHRVETSVTRSAFSGSATNVVVRGLIVEKYAIPAQMGAIGDQFPGAGWTIAECEARWNHGVGAMLGAGGQALGNHLHDNGQMGIGANGANILVENNEIDHNNYAGVDPGWEAGGSKFAETDGLVVRGNNVHHNFGPGLWTDIDNMNTLYENNVVEDNDHAGIFHEISYAAVIRNNQVRRNGRSFDVWLWGAQIQISTSRDVEIYGNVVEVGDGGNGIALIQQDRGTGAHGDHVTASCSVHDNTVTYTTSKGASGAVADWNNAAFWAAGNSFNGNTYHAQSCGDSRWEWADASSGFAAFQSHGQEATGSCVTP